MKAKELVELTQAASNFWELQSLVDMTGKKLEMGISRAGLSIDLAVKSLNGSKSTWKNLKGLRVLDLGCGSRMTRRYGEEGVWPPYWCLMMAALGNKVTGVDINEADPDDASYYRHIKVDLVTELLRGEKLRNIIPEGNINIVNTSMFPCSEETVPGNLREALGRHPGLDADIFSTGLEVSIMDLLVKGGVWVGDYDKLIVKD